MRLKAAETERSISELVNEPVKRSLTEDADDLGAFNERAGESSLPFEDVLVDSVNAAVGMILNSIPVSRDFSSE